MSQQLHITRMADGGYFVRPPTDKQIKVTSLPSGAQVYLGAGLGVGSLKVSLAPNDKTLEVAFAD